MENGPRAVVAAVRSRSYTPSSLRRAFYNLLDKMEPPLPKMIKAGDQVLVKPFLHNGRHGNPEDRLVSHPEVVVSVIEAIKDCGAVVALGDVGSTKLRNESIRSNEQWIHDLAKTSGVKLVNFAKTGARYIRSGLHFPRNYLITRAVLEVDHVVSCANFQPHYVLGMSGAVKNMFNAVVGKRQADLHELFPNPLDLARVIVDVCAVVRPTISFLDLTTVPDTEGGGVAKPVGLLLAGCDPVALDALAARAVGWDGSAMPTISAGEKQGLGCADLKRIKLSGLRYADLERIRLATVPIGVAKPESVFTKTTRLLNKTVLRARPVIDPALCKGCGDCQRICPVGAIRPVLDGTFSNNLRECADCHVCITACEHDAIWPQFVGVGKLARRLMSRPLATR